MPSAVAPVPVLLSASRTGAPGSSPEVRPPSEQPNLLSLGLPAIPPALAARLEHHRDASAAALARGGRP